MEGYSMQTCINEGCGISWFQPLGFDTQRRKDHHLFYCPNGHSQYYSGQNEEEKMRQKAKDLEIELCRNKDDLIYYKRSIRSLKGEITKLKKRR